MAAFAFLFNSSNSQAIGLGLAFLLTIDLASSRKTDDQDKAALDPSG
jgi:hypothetical protein